MPDIKKTIDKGIAYLKRNGIQRTVKRTLRKSYLAQPVNYEKWLKSHSASEKELQRQREEKNDYEIGIIIINNSGSDEELEKTRKSVKNQTYGKIALCTEKQKLWQLPYYLLITPGAVLRENAVYEMTRALKKVPEAELIYCDHDRMNEAGKVKDPFCKPQFDPVFLQNMNYIGAVCLISAVLLQKIGKNPSELFSSDLYEELRSFPIEREKAVRIPQILYSVLDNSDAGRIADFKNKKRETITDTWEKQNMISVIIPNKDHIEDLEKCVTSILEKGGYENLEILIVENNSEQKETFSGYELLKKKDERIKVWFWKKPYNYSAINNFAAKHAAGEYLLFLNNDTKVKEQGSLRELMEQMRIDKAGAAGARLLFEDETLQHGGVVLGYGGIAGHAFEGMTDAEYEKSRYAQAARQMTAVTAACMLVKKQAFYEVGGFTEELCVAYNDIDFCMKLQKNGWMVLYDPNAVWYHYESRTRGLELSAEKAKRVNQETQIFLEKWKKEIDRGDRFYNPNLTLELPDFSLLR